MHVTHTKTRDSSQNEFQHYLECCNRLGISNAKQQVEKMIVCDDILGNTDRHWRNFGVVRNVETLECRIAPLFDTGNSLWMHLSDDALANGAFTFTTKPFHAEPNQQLRLVEDYSWFDIDRIEDFGERAAEVLAGNARLSSRIPFIQQAIEERIERLRIIAA